MTTITKITLTDAIVSLGVGEFILRGTPASESEFHESFRRVVGAKDDGSAIESDDPATFGVTWEQVKETLDQLIAEEPMRLLREERNIRLGKTDWWGSPDREMTDKERKYRQDLRNITKHATSLNDVVWPILPMKAS